MSIDQEACLFSGSSHSHLAQRVAEYNQISLSEALVHSFPDEEISLQIQENVRGKTVFLMQSLAHKPNHYIMELLIFIDALKRASAKEIVVMLPYFAYARQDRKDKPRVAITAKLVASLLEQAGATHVLAMDLHADQIQGFFNIPMDHLESHLALIQAIEKDQGPLKEDWVIVAPDVGSIRMAKKYADALNVDYAVIDKRRTSSTKVSNGALIGQVKGKKVLLVDDLCSTAQTLCLAAQTCELHGALEVYASLAHGLFVQDAIKRIEQSPIKKLWVSNTLSFNESISSKKIERVCIAHLFAEAMKCILYKNSMSSLVTHYH